MMDGSRRSIGQGDFDRNRPPARAFNGETARYAPHILIVNQLERLNAELSVESESVGGAFDALAAMVDPLAYRDPEFPKFYDDVEAAELVCDVIEDEMGAVTQATYVRLLYPAYIGLLDRLGMGFSPDSQRGRGR